MRKTEKSALTHKIDKNIKKDIAEHERNEIKQAKAGIKADKTILKKVTTKKR